MNVLTHLPSLSDPRFIASPRPARRGAFALVITLLILSLLIVVAVSYLTSMSSERQTANAYSSAARAEQMAQAGVDSAMAILQQSFRDFPDSATVWDVSQSTNDGPPKSGNSAVVYSPYNEGTSLYLRAVPTSAPVNGTVTMVANPQPNSTAAPANAVDGNNPNNPGCENFVLPLISGVPSGRAQLVSNKAAILPTMNLSEPDPTKQNFVDLNIRRFGRNATSTDPIEQKYGDYHGVIGSPPEWAGTPTAASNSVVGPTVGSGYGPKPARAFWVNLTDSTGLVTGRYAFWIEDESFRANVNYANSSILPITPTTSSTRVDNGPDASTQKYPINSTTKQPYIVTPIDAGLSGALLACDTTNSTGDAQSVLNTRALYPGSFLPDPLAFTHSSTSATGAATLTTPVIDALRYLTTTQSGTLDLTRHGSERLNLNTTVVPVDLAQGSGTATNAIQNQINQLYTTLQFHLPNFGQRFYRTSTTVDSPTLNATQVVYNSTLKGEQIGDPNQIYFYKVAANLRDYIDSDLQPTLIQAGGTVYPVGPPPLYPFGDDGQPNPMWAVGKEATPFLQETAVRFRPVAPQGPPAGPKGTYTLAVDYYLEFWNMTDHDINGSDLNSPQIHISDQQTWYGYPSGIQLTVGDPSKPTPVSPSNDLTIDVSSVVFHAGAATVITTDPDYKSYVYTGPMSSYTSKTGACNPNTTFLCPLTTGSRTFAGVLPNQAAASPDYGLQPGFRDGTQDYHTEITFFNKYGYLDCALFSLAEGGSSVFTTTDKSTTPGGYNDYSYGGSLYGNSIASEMGDPRTNNEQMIFHRVSGAATGDLSRYYNGNHTLGYQDANYVQPVGGSFTPPGGSSTAFIAWPDYYTWPSTTSGYIALTAPLAPAVIADSPLISIGQLGDVFDPARISTSGSPETARGGGRTFKIGQRDDRVTYDPTGNPIPNNTLDNVPASLGWAAWRLTDIFSAGPVDTNNPTGPFQQPIELPGRVNINGVLRDNGAALRALLTGFSFQPATVDPSSGTSEPLFHTPTPLAGQPLALQPTASTGLANLVTQMTTRLMVPSTRLMASASSANVPWGPFFERGELGELEIAGSAIFGKNGTAFTLASTGLAGSSVDMNKTFDRGREELFRRLSEMICTRGDTFTVYAVGQSITQQNAQSSLKITSTHHLRVTFRLVPQLKDAKGVEHPFHPAYTTLSDADPTIVGAVAYNANPTNSTATTTRFAKPDCYDAQVLEVNVY